MSTPNELWQAKAGALAGGDAHIRARLLREVRLLTLARGAHAFEPGMECANYLIVLAGSVRVQLVAPSGREIRLYRVGPGESCVLTTSCLLNRSSYEAEALAETDVAVAAVPAASFRELLAEAPRFRDFVLAAYADRVSDLILTLEETVLQRVDRRIATALLARAQGDAVQATHDALAVECGTAREVVSRQLKAFAQLGLIERSRGLITIVDRAGLEKWAAGS